MLYKRSPTLISGFINLYIAQSLLPDLLAVDHEVIRFAAVPGKANFDTLEMFSRFWPCYHSHPNPV
jgi:hypothetical protein